MERPSNVHPIRPYDRGGRDELAEALAENAQLRAKVRRYERAIAVLAVVLGLGCLLTQDLRELANPAIVAVGFLLVVAGGVIWVDTGREA